MDNLTLNLPTVGSFLVGFFFVFFGIWNAFHWKPTLEFMVQKKLPFTRLLLAFGIALQMLTGLMLMINLYVKIAALILIIFDVVAVFIFHRFWEHEGEIRRLNMIIFITNLTGVLGALILLTHVAQLSPRLTTFFY